MKVLDVSRVMFSWGNWVSIRSNWIGVEERHPLKTLLAVLRRIANCLVRHINPLLYLLTHSTSVLFFVLVISTPVSDCGSSSLTFPETFIMTHFVVKHLLRSNRPSKFEFSVRYRKATVCRHRYVTVIPKLTFRRF